MNYDTAVALFEACPAHLCAASDLRGRRPAEVAVQRGNSHVVQALTEVFGASMVSVSGSALSLTNAWRNPGSIDKPATAPAPGQGRQDAWLSSFLDAPLRISAERGGTGPSQPPPAAPGGSEPAPPSDAAPFDEAALRVRPDIAQAAKDPVQALAQTGDVDPQAQKWARRLSLAAERRRRWGNGRGGGGKHSRRPCLSPKTAVSSFAYLRPGSTDCTSITSPAPQPAVSTPARAPHPAPTRSPRWRTPWTVSATAGRACPPTKRTASQRSTCAPSWRGSTAWRRARPR